LDAIKVDKVSKSFRLHHKKKESIYDLLTTLFTRNSYEILPVLQDISFSVSQGETLGVLGFNGSGKSTLLKLISEVYRPDEGKISINGSLIPLLELGIGFHPEMTADENIIMYGMILGFSKKDIVHKVDKIIEFSELEKFRDEKIKHFSSGMYGRLAFATAIQTDPDILLIDEVLAVGDMAFQQKCFEQLSSFRKKGKTIMLVTHDMGQVTSFCDKALLLHRGAIHAYGEPSDVVKAFQQIQKNN